MARRDIIRNTTMLCRNFWAAHEEAAEGDDPYLLLVIAAKVTIVWITVGFNDVFFSGK